ncbi:hypothetical protein VNI00_016732 [Paramarasmius palmivorus]|uniref:FAD-binding PCMH-type domain-containing protein n=1 Tax=Paramarasmius palmivorus TaxID=297713 RepID=A0AAW0BEV3_9AGAR
MKHQLLTTAFLSLLSAKFAYGSPAAACNALRSALPNSVFFPGSEEYTSDNRHHAEIASQNSTCSVEPETPEDVALILRTVASGDTRSPFAIKGGGHIANVGFSSTTGVQISMLKFNSIEYDEGLGTVKIGAGLVWGEVYLALAPHGVKVVGGRGPPVGVAGFLLGGGYSYFTDQYGLAIDNIVAHDLVLPNGTFVEVNEQTNPDLFFALKGGHNNFGIVTSFTLKTFPQTDVWTALISYPLNASDSFHRASESFSFNNTDLKAVALPVYAFSDDIEPGLLALLFYDGPVPPDGVYNEFFNVPGAVVNSSGTVSFADALGGGPLLSGPSRHVKTHRFFKRIPNPSFYRSVRDVVPITRYTVGILDEMKTQFENILSTAVANNRTLTFAAIVVEPFIQPNAHATDSAYPNPFVCPTALEVQWADATDDDFFFNLVREVHNTIQARAIEEGQSTPDAILYNNYVVADTPLELLYGDNLERLREIKRRVDPDNVMGLAGGFKIE